MHDYRSLKLPKCCLEWQIGNLKCDSWAMSLTHEMYKIYLGYISSDRQGRDLIGSCVHLYTANNLTMFRDNQTEKQMEEE
jgi:hypothetical protein